EPAGQEARDWYARATALGSTNIAFLPAIALQQLPMGDSLPAAFANRHAVAGDPVPVDWPVDRAARPLRRAPDKGQITALERPSFAAMARELFRQAFVRAVVLGHHHQARGVLVEPVHDAGTPLAADARQACAAVRDQGVDQRAGPMPGARMHHDAFR